MTSTVLSMNDNCQIYHLFNNKLYTNTDTNNISVAMKIFDDLIKEDVNSTTECLIAEFPDMIKEIESTKFNLRECKKEFKFFNELSSKLKFVIDFIEQYTIDVAKISVLLVNLKIAYNNLRTIADKFEDYIDVIEARREIKKGNTLTIEQIFSA